MKVVADSNFIIALAFEDDANHRRALEIWKGIDAAFLPVIAASEVAYFLLRNHQPLRLMEEILRDEKIDVEESSPSDLGFSLSMSKEVRQYDDFNDLLILGASRRLSLGLATFDSDLEALSARLSPHGGGPSVGPGHRGA